MRFRPHAGARFGALVPAAAVTYGVVSTWTWNETVEHFVLVGTIQGVVAYLTLRWILIAGVSLRDDHVTVHGVWFSRRVPRERAIEVTKEMGTTVLRWRTTWGEGWSAPMFAFTTMATDPGWFGSYNDRIADRINRWITHGDVPDAPGPRARARARERREGNGSRP